MSIASVSLFVVMLMMLAETARGSGLAAQVMEPPVDPLLGEKDVNDLWHRLGHDRAQLRAALGLGNTGEQT